MLRYFMYSSMRKVCLISIPLEGLWRSVNIGLVLRIELYMYSYLYTINGRQLKRPTW